MGPRRHRTAIVLAIALFATACGGSGGDDETTEVLGVQIDREGLATAEATPGPVTDIETPDAPTEPVATEAPTVPPDAATTAPPTDPAPPPAPEPFVLAAGDGPSPLVWSPLMDPDGGYCCWIEGSATSIDRDDPHTGLTGRLYDAVPAGEGAEPEPTARQQRFATCEATLIAPDDRAMRVDGAVFTRVRADGNVIASTRERVDATIPAGTTALMRRVEPALVDAADGRTVDCTVEFEAA